VDFQVGIGERLVMPSQESPNEICHSQLELQVVKVDLQPHVIEIFRGLKGVLPDFELL